MTARRITTADCLRWLGFLDEGMPPDVWLVQFGNRWFMRPWRPAFMTMAREVSRLRHIEECADELVQYESDLASSSSRLAALARADIALGELGRIVASHTKKEIG